MVRDKSKEQHVLLMRCLCGMFVCLLPVWVNPAQAVVFFTESFETDGQGSRYTASFPFNDGSNDYWNRGGNANFATQLSYLGSDGSSFWAAEDTNATDGNGNQVQTLEITGINIAGHTSLSFSGLFAATQNSFPPGFPFGSGNEHVKVLYQVDSGGFQNGVWFSVIANRLAQDTNFDGTGDGTELVNTFASFGFNIPNGSTLDLRIEVWADSSSEEIAFDFLQIDGTPAVVNPPPAATSSAASDVGEPEIGQTAYSFEVTYTDDSAIDVSTINISDVTVTGPGGLLTVANATESTGTDGTPRTGTYTVTPPGGSWDVSDNGTYTVGLVGNQVGDDGSPQLFVAANAALTTFSVNAANSLPVVNNVGADDVIFTDIGLSTYTFTIEYSDVGGIDVSSIDASDVTVTGPGGALTVTGGSESSGTDGSPKTATYTVTPPGGTWDRGDAGTYTIGIVSDQVFDVHGGSVVANPSVATFGMLPEKLLNESFESDGQGVRYTASQPFNAGPDDYWNRGEDASFDTLTAYIGEIGSFFWAAEDSNHTPGGTGAAVQTIDLAQLTISGHENLQFTGLFASTANSFFGPGNPFVTDEHVKVLYSVDGGTFQNGVWFTPNTSEHLALDTNFDGTGEGAELTATFSPASFTIPNGTTLDLRIEVKTDNTSEEVAFDSLMVTGDLLPENVAPSVASFSATDVGELEIGLTSYDFTVTYTDESAIDVSTIDVTDVMVTGPGGLLTITGANEPTGTDGSPRTATYTVTPPGGSWDASDNGIYTISIVDSEVGDDGGPQLFVAANASLTTFSVNAANPEPTVTKILAEDVIFTDVGESTYTFTLEYSDVAGVDVSSIDAGDVTVTGPGGPLTVTAGSESSGTDGSPKTATYTVTAPGGSWDVDDAGTYTVGVVSGQVVDVLGAFVAANSALVTFDMLPGKLLNESFESDGQGSRYTASQPFNVGLDDYWDRGTAASFGTLTSYVGEVGSFFWAAEDVNHTPGGDGADVQSINFAQVDISGHENLQFTGLFASTANTFFGPGNPFVTDEHIKVLYSVDSGPFQNGVWFAPNADEHLALDTDFDGTGDGAALTEAFASSSFSIPNGSTLDLRIEVKADSTSEEVAFDSLMVAGDLVPINPSIQITKDPATQLVTLGSNATFTITVTNTGDVALSNVTVTDVLAPDCDLSGVSLAVGASTSYVCTITNVLADFTNSVVVIGTPPVGDDVTDLDDAVVDAINPMLNVMKTVSLDGSCPGQDVVQGTNGASVAYCLIVTNAGDVALSDVTLDDVDLGLSTNVGTLAVGQLATVTVVSTVSGDLTNTVSATADDPNGNDVGPVTDDTVVEEIAPALGVSKTVSTDGSCSGSDLVQVTNGTTVTFCFVVTNAGDVAMSNVTLDDSDIIPALSTNVGTVTVGQVVTVSVDRVATVDLTNTVAVVGEDPNGDAVGPMVDPAEVDVINPSIEITKDPATQLVTLSSNATFTITVTNTGDVALSNVTVTDVLAPDCDLSSVSLAVGASTSYVCTITNVLADFTNSAVVIGTPPVGDDVTDSDDAEVDAINPMLDVMKTVSLDGSCPGQDVVQGTNGASVTYCLIVTNAGDVALSDVALDDVDLGLSTNVGTLAVGQLATVTVVSTVSGDLTNTVSATADDPNGNDVGPVTDDTIVEEIAPALGVSKTVSTDGSCSGLDLVQVTNGTIVTYCFVVTNAGDVAMSNVTLNDPDIIPVLNTNVGTMSVGQIVTVSVDRVATVDLTNTVAVAGEDPNGDVVGPVTDLAEVDVINPPICGPDMLERNTFSGLRVLISVLLSNDTAQAGGVLSITSVQQPASGNATTTIIEPFVYYRPDPNFTTNDTFTYTLSESGGMTAICTVSVSVVVGDAGTINLTDVNQQPGPITTITGVGVPGRTFVIEVSTDSGATWLQVGTAQADGLGQFVFTHDPSPLNAMYRAVFVTVPPP